MMYFMLKIIKMYILRDTIWQWDYQPYQLKQINFNKNIYLHTNDTLSILNVRIYTDTDIIYNHEKVLHAKLMGGCMTLCNEINTVNHRTSPTLCDICGHVKQYCLYYILNNTLFNVCQQCYQELHVKKPKYIINTRPSKVLDNHEQKIDVAYKYNNQVIFLCRNTFKISKLDMMNNIYFKNQPWYTIKRQTLCDYCYKYGKYSTGLAVCVKCHHYTEQLLLEQVNIYLNITSFHIPNDIIHIILYNYILCIGYSCVDLPKITFIRYPPVIELPTIQLDDTITTETESEEDYTYIIENYEDVYGLNDNICEDEELGHWDDNDTEM